MERKGKLLEEGPLRKLLRGRGRRSSPEVVPTIARSEMGRLITDEEKAWVEYNELANHPAIRQNASAQSTILKIAEDEQRHAQQLKLLLNWLFEEGKLV